MHDFGVTIIFISVDQKVEYNSTAVSKEDLHTWRIQEDTDTKIIVHVKHCLLSSFRNAAV